MSNASEYMYNIIDRAMTVAKGLRSKYLLLEHLLYAYITDEKVSVFLANCKEIKYKELYNDINAHISCFPLIEKSDEDPIVSASIQVYMYYYFLTYRCNEVLINDKEIINVISALSPYTLMKNTHAEGICSKNGINENFISNVYQQYASQVIIEDKIKPMIKDDSTMSGSTTSVIDKYTINLSEIINKKSWIKIVGRDDEMDLLHQVLCRKDKPNAILVGNDGIGKKKIVEGLTKKLKDNIVYQLDILSLMSNIYVKGELENRIKNLGEALHNIPNAILFIEDIHNMCSGSDSNGGDIASLLKPLLKNGDIKIIGTTTFEEYRKYMEKDETFVSLFYKMNIEESSLDEVFKVLMKVSKSYERFFNIKYSKETLKLIVDLSQKYIFDKHFPEKAIDVLDMVGAYCSHKGIKEVSKNDVYVTVSKMQNIPLSNLSQSEEDIYKNLETILSKSIIGQDEAVKKVSEAVIISKSGLRESNKTAITLMFRGESGTGKTQLAKDLAETLHIPFVRFDMSEFMEENSVSKLIGAPPGYKDAGNGKAGNGLLINAIDEHPYCVLLLDEIEKAHSKIHNLLLQVMDNGKLTSSMGKQVSFENVFLIMTSNVGGSNMHKTGIGFGNLSSPSDEDYNSSFLPEFRNRIDASIRFNKLNNEVLKKITNKFMQELSLMLTNKKIKLKYGDELLDYIVHKSDTDKNGARPLKHLITNEIKNIIGRKIVFGEYREKDTIKISVKNNELQFEGGINE